MTDGIPGALREIGKQNPHLAMAMKIAADEIEGLGEAITRNATEMAMMIRVDDWLEVRAAGSVSAPVPGSTQK